MVGEKWEKSKVEEVEKRWERKLLVKRVVFDKLGMSCFWIFDWSILMVGYVWCLYIGNILIDYNFNRVRG